MSEYRKAHADNLYFITLTVVGWIDVFSRREYKDIIVSNLQYCQQNEGLDIFCYAIMSNHFHAIVRRNEKELSELLGRFKSTTAKQIIKAIENNPKESRREWLLYMFNYFAKQNEQYSKYHFWQYKNQPVVLYTNEVIDQKRDYIHHNPVRAGLVANVQDYI
jgi:REP element-mobilizing transposase RayT